MPSIVRNNSNLTTKQESSERKNAKSPTSVKKHSVEAPLAEGGSMEKLLAYK